jgi:aminoglycoside phosphotransferase (APT) family kinase protein
MAREIGADSVRRVPIHADLTPTNIVVDNEGRVTVLDFTMAKAGTEYDDLTHVYFQLELMRRRHRSRRKIFQALQRALLAGYDPSLSSDHPLFRMMLMQHAVCHVALLAERRLPVLDVAYRWFVRRRWTVCDRMSAPAERQVA